ncbi:hypothetical protein M569_02377, partial [Genlisea aurea]
MPIVTGDRYLESLVKFVENHAERLIEGSLELKLNPVGLRYVQSRLEALEELENLLVGAPVDYLRAYVSDLGDHRALEQLRKILRLLPSLKVVSVLPPPGRDPTPLTLLPFARLKVLELRGCDLSTSTAKGLLPLRFTLEKFICHNSTDALRHLFTSRIADVKDSPQWTRLSFVSCTCNGLILMDDSLQLLPMVESLDLSRNKFAKVDNLNKCARLKLVDLGYNRLKSIASFAEVYCRIEKLVLRNNALISLHGIENLHSLQDLDLSYNIISSFSEIERLSGLLSLQRLWLEGNPLCYSRWYRPKVFSLFTHPEQLKLDDKKISPSEFWKRKIINMSRIKEPASFGFYSPATNDADVEGSINTKRVWILFGSKQASRLASIGYNERIESDQDSVSLDNESQSNDENADDGDREDDVKDFMRIIEFMKKDDPVLWLKAFKEWMNQTSQDFVGAILNNSTNESTELAERSRHVPNSTTSNATTSSGISPPDADVQLYLDRIGAVASRIFLGGVGFISVPRSSAGNPDDNKEGGGSSDAPGLQITSASGAENGITGSTSAASPPHYQEDILLRRNKFQEEYLRISSDSLSASSSDTDTTSCSIDDEDSKEAGGSECFADDSATTYPDEKDDSS